MKRLLLFSTLCFLAFSTKAQVMDFEETVKYINEKITNNPEYHFVVWPGANYYSIKEFQCSKGGEIRFKAETGEQECKFNFFKLNKIKDITLDNDRAIGFWKTDDDAYTVLVCENSIDAERVYKSLLHLRSLCTKEKDPFD